MSERKINLEELLVDEAKKDIGDYKWVDFEEVYKEKNLEDLQRFVIEFGRSVAKDVLELAAENADTKYLPLLNSNETIEVIDEDSILDTINQIE